jgi:5-aminolevulinate synthase
LDYSRIFTQAIDRLHAEGRYRVFIDILRNKGMFPNARCFAGHNGPKPITVWCSNDYLAMGQHPKVIAAMEEALHDVGAGSGGTRNIGGNTHYHVDLEYELADLHGKEGALVFTSGYVSNWADAWHARQQDPRHDHLLGCAEPRLYDRGHPLRQVRSRHLEAQ